MTCQVNTLTTRYSQTLAYEIFISVLALVAVLTSVVDISGTNKIINNIVLLIFAIDYIMRLVISANKKTFFKENILDFIAILPLSSLLRGLRMIRLLKVLKMTKTLKFLRAITFSARFHKNIKKFLHTNGFIYALYVTTAIILLGSVLLYTVEKDGIVTSFEDAIWLSFCSASLFGYEGIETVSPAAKIILGSLVLIGLCFTGMFTGTVAAFFINGRDTEQTLENKILDLSDLSDSQFEEVQNYIKYVKYKRQHQES